MTEDFDYCVKWLFVKEGENFTNDPDDKPTKYGIIQDDLDELGIKKKLEDLTAEEARECFKILYWDKLMLNSVEDREMTLHLIDSGVLQGVNTTIMWVQRLLNILEPGPNTLKVDGLMGMGTLLKINGLMGHNKETFYKRLAEERKVSCRRTAYFNVKKKKYVVGWEKRINSLPGVSQ